MKKRNAMISLILVSGLILPVTGSAHSYKQTADYQDIVTWGESLKGVSFHDGRYTPYCIGYAQVAAAQAKQRTSQSCTNAIPTHNPALKNRWSNSSLKHRSWCQSVSAHASQGEAKTREANLKNCMVNHTHVNTIKRDCEAGHSIHKKAARGDFNYVRNCLNAGVNVNLLEGNNWTPLHSAARHGRLKIAKLLMSWGANVNAKDVNGHTPMDQAAAGGYPDTITYLASEGGV